MNLSNNQLNIYPVYAGNFSGIDTADLSQMKSVASSPLILRHSYSLAEVEIAESPDGNNEEDWYRYVLVRGASRITGYHRGTLTEVTEYANECIGQINDRNRYNKSTSPLKKSK